MRDAIRFDLSSGPVFATVHRPLPEVHPVPTRCDVILLNAGQVPRDGHGGLAAHVGDALAAAGVTTWRVDLPGLGDSPGPLPQRAEVFWRMVDTGGQRDAVLEVVEAVAAHSACSRFFIGGLCGAAVNAIYAAARRPRRVAGLILWEPEFFLSPLTGEVEEVSSHTAVRWAKKLTSRAAWTRVLSGETDIPHALQRVRRRLIPLLLHSSSLPENANLSLISEFARVAHRRTPTLVVTAAGHIRDVTTRQVMYSLFGEEEPVWLALRSIEETNHIFTAGHGIPLVAEATTGWLLSLVSTAISCESAHAA